MAGSSEVKPKLLEEYPMPEVFSEADFQAEMDADTLARAKEIEANPDRVNRAIDAVKRKAAALNETAETIRRPPDGPSQQLIRQGFVKVEVSD